MIGKAEERHDVDLNTSGSVSIPQTAFAEQIY